MHSLLLFMILSINQAEIREPLHCIPCTRAYTTNKILFGTLVDDWCPKSIQEESTNYVARFRERCGESNFHPRWRSHICVPCTSIRNKENFSDTCRKLYEVDDLLFGNRSSHIYPDHLEKCTGIISRYKVNNGTCMRLFYDRSCPDGEWLIYAEKELKCAPRKCERFKYEYNGVCLKTGEQGSCPDGVLAIQSNGVLKCECPNGINPYTDRCVNTTTLGDCGPLSKQITLDDGSVICIPRVCPSESDLYIEDDNITTIAWGTNSTLFYQMRCWSKRDLDIYCNTEKGCEIIHTECNFIGTHHAITPWPCSIGFSKVSDVCKEPSFFKILEAKSAILGSSIQDECPAEMIYDKGLERCLFTVQI